MSLPDIDSLWDYRRPDLTEERFRAVLAEARESGQPAYLAELLTQIARTHSLRCQFETANALLDEAQTLLPALPTRAGVRYLLERGRCLNSAGEPESARPLFLRAWEDGLACKEDLLAVDAAHMVAIVEAPEQALSWNHKALELAEQSNQPGVAERWTGSLYNNIGWTYHDMGDYGRALQVFQQALEWRQEQEQSRETRTARWCVGRALRSLGRNAEALAIQQQNLREIEVAGESDAYIQEEMGELLLAQGDKANAASHFRPAYATLSKDEWLKENEPSRLERLKGLGDTN